MFPFSSCFSLFVLVPVLIISFHGFWLITPPVSVLPDYVPCSPLVLCLLLYVIHEFQWLYPFVCSIKVYVEVFSCVSSFLPERLWQYSFRFTFCSTPGWLKLSSHDFLFHRIINMRNTRLKAKFHLSQGVKPKNIVAFSAHSCFNVIVKFADDTTVVGLITDNDETADREEVHALTRWCQENHLSLNINKTNELVVDFRRQKKEHNPIIIDGTPVKRASSFKFLGVHITEDLTWSAHTDAVLKKAQQRLFFLRRLRRFGMSHHILHSFYTCTVESILTGCITAWYGNSTSSNRKHLQRVVRTARHTVGGELPSLQDIYTRRCMRKARRIISDSSHPSHGLFSLLPSGRRIRSIRSRTSRLRDSFFPQTIRLLNTPNWHLCLTLK